MSRLNESCHKCDWNMIADGFLTKWNFFSLTHADLLRFVRFFKNCLYPCHTPQLYHICPRCSMSPQCVWTADGRGGQQHLALLAAHWEEQGEWTCFTDKQIRVHLKKKIYDHACLTHAVSVRSVVTVKERPIPLPIFSLTPKHNRVMSSRG